MIAIYSRQSLEKKESISIESQIEFSKREVFDEEFKIYSDSGYSGKNINRPAFKNMMNDVKNGKIDKVIVYRLDRISRSLVDFADFMEILEDNNTAFVSATEKIDTSTPMGRAMLYIVVIFAQLERETIASRVQDNYFARVSGGAWGGGLPPFGFELQRILNGDKHITILSPTEKLKVVECIFNLYGNENLSLSQIQKETQKEIKTEKFTSSKLSKILKNPVYAKCDFKIFDYYSEKNIPCSNNYESFVGENGAYLTRSGDKLLSLAPHKGIINSDLFIKCQKKLESNRGIKNQGKGKHTWLTGLVKCGYCGYSFSVRTAKTRSGDTKYFSCSGKYIHRYCTEKQTHKVYDIEEYVAKEVLQKLEKIEIPIKSNIENTYEKEISKIEYEIEHFIRQLEIKNEITTYYIQEKITNLHNKKEELIKKSKLFDEKNSDVKYMNFKSKDFENLTFENKCLLMKSIISKIELTRSEIKIFMNI